MSNFNFDSSLAEKHEIESKIENQHSFSSTLLNSHAFESIVDGFLVSATWFIKFASSTGINISSVKTISRSLAQFTTVTGMAVDRLLVNVGIRPRVEFITATAISVIMSAIQKMGLVNFSSPSNFEVRMRDLVKVNSVNIFLTTTDFQTTATANQYYLVSDWDASLLSTLDTMLLSELDSQIV